MGRGFWVFSAVAVCAYLLRDNETMKKWAMSARSEANLIGVNSRLVEVVRAALEKSPYDFGITSGLRTAAEQKKLYDAGASQLDGTLKKSYHQTGNAVDIVVYKNGSVTWDYEDFVPVANVFKAEAARLGVVLEWGGDWSSFIDAPHFEYRGELL